MRPMGPGGFNQRPAPYDRGDRFGGMNRYNSMGRGSRSFKGEFVVVNVSLLNRWPIFMIESEEKLCSVLVYLL
jgi:hypothetical protein